MAASDRLIAHLSTRHWIGYPDQLEQRPSGAPVQCVVTDLKLGLNWPLGKGGVERVLAGYAGGSEGTAHYERVGRGDTGHAESVEIRFDPGRLSYGEILQIYFSVVHDPTQLDRQGPDVGPQYRSSVFYVDDAQKRIAEAYIAQLARARVFPAEIVTRVDPLRGFYPAEAYHQDFMIRHPTYPYIVVHDLPKLARFKAMFPARYTEDPVTALRSK